MRGWLLTLVGVVLSTICLRRLAFGKARETIAQAKRRVFGTQETA